MFGRTELEEMDFKEPSTFAEKCPSGKFSSGKMLSGKCPFGKMSFGLRASGKCPGIVGLLNFYLNQFSGFSLSLSLFAYNLPFKKSTFKYS